MEQIVLTMIPTISTIKVKLQLIKILQGIIELRSEHIAVVATARRFFIPARFTIGIGIFSVEKCEEGRFTPWRFGGTCCRFVAVVCRSMDESIVRFVHVVMNYGVTDFNLRNAERHAYQ